ncbi:MAG: hypothetical protein ABEK17_02170, partial [Candidatus Aenigmatarchaeota archaeon]
LRLVRSTQKDDMLKRYEQYFEDFWKRSEGEFYDKEKRLASMSHVYRCFKRSLENGEELTEREIRKLKEEAKELSYKTDGHLSKLFLAANRKFGEFL